MVASMMTKRLRGAVAAVGVTELLAACGSGGSGGDGAGDSGDDDVASLSDDNGDEQAQGDDADTDEELLDWVARMRDQGVDLPAPTRDLDGNVVIEGPGIRLGVATRRGRPRAMTPAARVTNRPSILRARDRLLVGGSSTVGVPRDANAHAGPESVAAVCGPLPGVLDVSIQRRGNVIELSLAGALDIASASRLGEAMALAREMATTQRNAHPAARDFPRGHTTTIMIDTSDIDVVDSSGYQALQEALVGPNGLWDPGVTWIIGPAVVTFEASIYAVPTPSARDGDDHRRRPPRREWSKPPGL
jgi:hypothetical protein